jgi:hypothetical protein
MRKFVMRLGILSAACVALAAALTAAAQQPVQPHLAPKLAVLVPPIATRMAQSTVVVVGKVESIEEKTVAAKQDPNAQDKSEYQIAVIKIEDPILVEKGLTHIRVGFVPPAAKVNPNPMIRPIGGIKPLNFAKDQEVLVFLTPHFEGNFLSAPNGMYEVEKQGNQNFEKDVAEAKRFAKLLENPKESLKSEKQEDRYAAAAVLIQRYRFKQIGATDKTEAVDAEISKLILTTLAEADWTNAANTLPRLTPQILFNHFGLSEKDGWKQPKNFADLATEEKKWCKDNAEKYRIQRYVNEKAEKSDK